MVTDSQRPSEQTEAEQTEAEGTEAPRAGPCGGPTTPPPPPPPPRPPKWSAGVEAEAGSGAGGLGGALQPSRRKRSPCSSRQLLGRVAAEGAAVKGPKGMPANA